MPFTSFINITIDPSATKKAENHVHQTTQAASAGGDMCVSIDNAKVTTMSVLNTALAAVRRAYAGQLPP